MERGEELQQSSPDLSSDFAFGFDDPAFSDRILKLLIFDDKLNEKSKNGSNDLIRSLKLNKEDITESPEEYSSVKSLSLNICSLILAAKSPFFRKLFTNGMKASNQHEVTLHIHSSEEAAFMDVIKFMYNENLLSASTPTALIKVLVTADKYDVPSCINYCCALLLSHPMTARLALIYIDLTSIMSMNAIQPLLKKAQYFLPIIFKDISKYQNDIIDLSLDGIKLVLSRDDLKVDSEDKAYDLLVQWSKQHFQDPDERFRVLKAEMFNLIRFQYLTPQKLKSVVAEFYNSNHLDSGVVSSMIETVLDDSKFSLPRHRRAYKLIPVAILTFEIPNRHCVVYMDLKREDCKDIEVLYSQSFVLDKELFELRVQRSKHESKGCTFGLFLRLRTLRKQSTEVKFEFSARQKRSPETFTMQIKRVSCTFTEGEVGWGFTDLFKTTWDAVMAEDSQFFINGTMHLKIDVTLED